MLEDDNAKGLRRVGAEAGACRGTGPSSRQKGQSAGEESRVQSRLDGAMAAALLLFLPALEYVVIHWHTRFQLVHAWSLLCLSAGPLLFLSCLQVLTPRPPPPGTLRRSRDGPFSPLLFWNKKKTTRWPVWEKKAAGGRLLDHIRRARLVGAGCLALAGLHT